MSRFLLVVNGEGPAVEAFGRNLNCNGANINAEGLPGIIRPADVPYNLDRALCKYLEPAMPPLYRADFGEDFSCQALLFWCSSGRT